MSISVKLSDIRTAISSAYGVVSAKGGSVPAQQTLNALPTVIQGIPSGGGSDSKFKNLVARSFTSLEDNTVTYIGDRVFYFYTSLTKVSFSVCTYMGHTAFGWCSSLSTATFPMCTSIGYSAFYSCISLTTISFPVCTSIGSYAFTGCSRLSTASFPMCTYIGYSAFTWCSRLSTASFPMCTYIGGTAFSGCFIFPETVSFPMCTYIGGAAFFSCSRLTRIYIGTSNCTLANSSAFSKTGIWSTKGFIYVPSDYVETYKTATHWVYFSNRIFGY